MTCTTAGHAVLTVHPATPGASVRGLGVELRAEEHDVLAIHYSLDADMPRLRLPSPGEGRRTEGLWKHTCFEAFIAPIDAPEYHEFNFSPSHDWAAYRFSAYRETMSAVDVGEPPKISVRRGERGLELRSAVSLHHLPELRDAPRLRIGLAAVIEDDQGRLSYWALRHTAGKPDFHHPDGFTLELART